MAVTNVLIKDDEVSSTLEQLGLKSGLLVEAVRRGQVARNATPRYEPRTAPGMNQYQATVGALRNLLIPEGWTEGYSRGLEMVIDPSNTRAIITVKGCANTGCYGVAPTTISERGKHAEKFIETNSNQLGWFANLFDEFKKQDTDSLQMWYLVRYTDYQEGVVRSELSLPVDLNAQKKVSLWQTRIILKSIPIDSETYEYRPDIPGNDGDGGDDIDIPINKRTE